MGKRHAARSARPVIQSLERGFRLLELVARNGRGTTLAEVSRAARLHPSTAFHLLRTLVSLGYLAHDPETRRAVLEYVGSRIVEASRKSGRGGEVRVYPVCALEAWQARQNDDIDQWKRSGADRLLREVMQARGYPVEDFEQRVADISVDYPDMVVDYRGLHDIAARGNDEEVTTEEMRTAMIHGRALFENLVRGEQRVEESDEKERV